MSSVPIQIRCSTLSTYDQLICLFWCGRASVTAAAALGPYKKRRKANERKVKR